MAALSHSCKIKRIPGEERVRKLIGYINNPKKEKVLEKIKRMILREKTVVVPVDTASEKHLKIVNVCYPSAANKLFVGKRQKKLWEDANAFQGIFFMRC